MKSTEYSMEELLQLVQEKAMSYNEERIMTAANVFSLLYKYSLKEKEYFLMVTLDGGSHVIEQRVIHIGTLNQSLVHPREVFRPAILDNAAGIILAHNHPSGTLEASRSDVQITRRLQEVSKLVGIDLLDHVILSQQGYYSFSDEGLL